MGSFTVDASFYSASFLKAECPNAALSWLPVKTYERSLAPKAQLRTKEPVEETETSADIPSVIGSQRTTPQGGMGIRMPGL